MGWSIWHDNRCIVDTSVQCLNVSVASVHCCYLEVIIFDAEDDKTILKSDRVVGV